MCLWHVTRGTPQATAASTALYVCSPPTPATVHVAAWRCASRTASQPIVSHARHNNKAGATYVASKAYSYVRRMARLPKGAAGACVACATQIHACRCARAAVVAHYPHAASPSLLTSPYLFCVSLAPAFTHDLLVRIYTDYWGGV